MEKYKSIQGTITGMPTFKTSKAGCPCFYFDIVRDGKAGNPIIPCLAFKEVAVMASNKAGQPGLMVSLRGKYSDASEGKDKRFIVDSMVIDGEKAAIRALDPIQCEIERRAIEEYHAARDMVKPTVGTIKEYVHKSDCIYHPDGSIENKLSFLETHLGIKLFNALYRSKVSLMRTSDKKHAHMAIDKYKEWRDGIVDWVIKAREAGAVLVARKALAEKIGFKLDETDL